MKKSLAFLLSLILLLSNLQGLSVKAAENTLLWRQNATMDINLNVIEGKTGKDDILLELDVAENGKYLLEYFLQDGEKKTLEITNNPDELLIDFLIEKGNAAAKTNETKNEMGKYFLSADYTGDIPAWKSYKGAEIDAFIKADKLHYTVNKNASAKFPGAAFNVNNKITMIRGDFNSGKAYIYFDKYQSGSIVPIKVTTPSGEVKTLNVLKNLSRFSTTPTHIVPDKAVPGSNKNLDLVVVPSADASEKAGSKPGIRLQFDQPKALDEASWTFTYAKAEPILANLSAVFKLRDLAGTANMDIAFSLGTAGSKAITSLPEAGDSAQYTLQNNQYRIDIVKEETGLATPENFVTWRNLEKSKIYKASLDFAKRQGQEADVFFPPFTPENEFAYTYMEFTLKRADKKEAYLEITPYDVGDSVDLEYTILYNKTFIGQLDEKNNLWLKHYQRNDENQTKINIPVPFDDNSSQDHYQVLFRFSSTNIRSQILNYQAEKDKDVPPAMPNIVLVDNLYITPPEQDAVNQNNPSQIQFDLVWDAMDKAELDRILTGPNDAVYYELSVNTLPGENDSNKYEVIKVYEVSKKNGAIHLAVHPSLQADTWQGRASQTKPQYTDGYDKVDELLRMEKIVLFQQDQWTYAHEATYDEEKQTYTVVNKSGENKRIKDLSFPGVNYLKLRTYIKKDNKVTRSRLSLPHSFSMSMLVYDVPTVNNLRYDPIYTLKQPESVGVGIRWDWNKNKTDFKTYKESMLDPLGKKAETIKYIGYISTDRSKVMKIGAEDKVNALPLKEGISLVESEISVTPQQLENFRNKEIYFFEVNDRNHQNDQLAGGEFLTQIKGLDPNEVYYIRFVVEMQIKNRDLSYEGINGEKKPRTSTPSVILEVTTPKLNPEPGEDEKLPLAPEQFEVDFLDEEKVQSYAQWEIPNTLSPEDKNIGFELLNVESQSLDEKLKDNAFSMEELVSGVSTDPAKQKLLEQRGVQNRNTQSYRVVRFDGAWQLEQYDKETKQWKIAPQSDFSMEGKKIRVIDKKNSPNRVLYYYVRTVKYNAQKAVLSRSAWREATLTTPELKRPINLKIDYHSIHEHNPKQERILYFDVPMPEGVTLHDNYLVQIFVRGEKDHDYKMTGTAPNGQSEYGSVFIKSTTGAPTNYQRLYYKVYGLEAGKTYEIKVRLEDRTKEQEKNPDGTLSYTTSPFSDVVKTRTEFDQATLDKENKYKEYIEVYLKEAQELKKNPYFDLTVDGKQNVFKYRGPYAQGEMRGKAGNRYDLAKGDRTGVVYYLPAEMIKSAPENGTDLRIWLNEQLVVLPRGFVTEADTEEIKEAIRKAKEYQGSVKDYALKIQLTTGKYEAMVDGKTPLQPMLHIQMQVVRQTRTEAYLDNLLLSSMENAINKNKVTLINELEKELRFGIKEDKLNDIVNKVLLQVQKDFASTASYQYHSVIHASKSHLNELEREMEVTLKPNKRKEFTVYFRESGNFERMEKDSTDAVSIAKVGSFIAVEDAMASAENSLLTEKERKEQKRYRLDRVFSAQEWADQSPIYGQQLIRTAARMLGAGDSNDTAEYLKSKGIEVPKISPYQVVSKEKGLYLLAQVYAKKNNLSLKSVRITDYSAIEDEESIDRKWRKELVAAYHLKLFSLRNDKLFPKANMSMKELKEFLRRY